MTAISELASYRHILERMQANWPAFADRRKAWLVQQDRHGNAAEKVAENILQDLLTTVLDWSVSDLNNQHRRADLVITRGGIKVLLIEAKRPGALAWHRRSVDRAITQARGYADEQKVGCIGVSDGVMLYAADILSGGAKERLYVSLSEPHPPEALWWLSIHGIVRSVEKLSETTLQLPEIARPKEGDTEPAPYDTLLHPIYHLPAQCFAYVGNAAAPSTWKLPYLLASGGVDMKRLPKAIGAILSNYRGARVDLDEKAVPDVLVRLARAASLAGRLPHQNGGTARVYVQLVAALEQLGRTSDISGIP